MAKKRGRGDLNVYVVMSRYHYDDYKRASSSVSIEGVFRDEEDAYEKAFEMFSREYTFEMSDKQRKSFWKEVDECDSWYDKFYTIPKEPYGQAEFTSEASGTYYYVCIKKVQ